jgi:hypothetical protein
VTECQGCGAWNDTSRTFCVLCGTPLAEIDEWDAAAELPPLPPLPDGGLRASMPSWLREPPVPIATDVPDPPSLPPVAPAVTAETVAGLVPLGPRADPRTFLSDDDFPQWLRDLARRREGSARHFPPNSASRREPEPEREAPPAEPAPAATVDAPLVPSFEERRGRNLWETLLLLLLCIGVIAAALWALISNGILSGPYS